MLKEKSLFVFINTNNLHHFISLNYDVKVYDEIKVPVSHLMPGSHVIVTGVCDNCGKEKQMKYQTYYKYRTKYLCRKCAEINRKNTNIEKYGYENVSQSPGIKDKISKSMTKH